MRRERGREGGRRAERFDLLLLVHSLKGFTHTYTHTQHTHTHTHTHTLL